jgi:N-acetylmuramoyl-L-alanine amidase
MTSTPVSRRTVLTAALAALNPLSSWQQSAQAASRFDRVVLDPGHGGKDPGSKWYGITEKSLTLDLAKRTQSILKSKGVPVTLTRTSDVFIELEDRAAMANQSARTIFVSLHFNAHRDRSIKGIESFYYPGSEDSRLLANSIQGELGGRILTRNRGIKPSRLKVLEATKGTAALVECGFISNRWECQRSASAWLRQVLAEEIVQGILRFR